MIPSLVQKSVDTWAYGTSLIWGGGYILPEHANLTFYRSPKNFVGTEQKFFSEHNKTFFRDIPEKFSGHTQKLASKHMKILPDIEKFSLTSRNFRNYTKIF